VEKAQTVLGASGRFALRPEKIHLAPAADSVSGPSARGVVVETIYLGVGRRIVVDLEAGQRLVVLEPSTATARIERGDPVVASWRAEDLVKLS
jgi:putative spermidine/putrescine transport system ATP-binding protein